MLLFLLFSLLMANHDCVALDVDLDSLGTSNYVQPCTRFTSSPGATDKISSDSIKSAAKAVASNLMSYYKGTDYGQIIGILPGPPPAGEYYWWEAGALWGTLIDYWHMTGDTTWNDVIEQSFIFQAGGPRYSYMPLNWSIAMGNDDQGFWGMSAMLAAETNFQNPPADKPQWLALAQAVFNTQAAADRHDGTCGGGLRWQIQVNDRGYDYKNSIANGLFFNLGARLARYTDNETYADWASNIWDWEVGVGLTDPDYNVFDGAHVEHNCTDIYRAQFTYCAAVVIQSAAFLYNHVSYNLTSFLSYPITKLCAA